MQTTMAASAGLPVTQRMNAQLFRQAAQGSPVRLGGHLGTSPSAVQHRRTITTTDGATLTLVDTEIGNMPNDSVFVEVTGTKDGDDALRIGSVVPFNGTVDAELWD